MKDAIITILMIVGLILGIPLLIVYVKDRGGYFGLITNRVFGGISFLFGLIIIMWVIYNLFWLTEEFKSSFKTVFQLAVPIALVSVGWNWLTSKEGK